LLGRGGGWGTSEAECYANNYYYNGLYCGISDSYSSSPIIGSFIDIAVTKYNACAIDTNGVIQCWGSPAYLGLTSPPGGNWTTSDFVQIEAGNEHFCALDSTGVIHCWGDNTFEELEVPFGLHSFVSLDVGWDHSCGVKSSGELLCWGSDDELQLYDAAWVP
jgi:alpha-tubulin suppressor-like RCC1 family protein